MWMSLSLQNCCREAILVRVQQLTDLNELKGLIGGDSQKDLEEVYLVKELVVQFMTVIKNVFVCGVQTRLHAVLHNHTGSGWTLKLLYLHTHKYTRLKDMLSG